jgi:hypothetical protein
LAACAASAIACAWSVVACIAAPPPELPKLPAHRPTIVHGSVAPPPTQILTALPDEFLVPVELVDPSQTFHYNVFVDYDLFNNPQAVYQSPEQAADPNAANGIDLVTFSLSSTQSALDPSYCHVIEMVVANKFTSTSPHTPDSVGGDSVSWFYSPGGNPAGCPQYDAGSLADGAFPDVQSDALVVPDGNGEGGS